MNESHNMCLNHQIDIGKLIKIWVLW